MRVAELLDLLDRRLRNRDEADVAVSEVHNDAVVMVGDERARLAALRPRRIEHEVVDDELAVRSEKIGERLLAGRRVESVFLVDLHPRQLTDFLRDRVLLACEFLLFVEQREAFLEPCFARDDTMFVGGCAGGCHCLILYSDGLDQCVPLFASVIGCRSVRLPAS